jgi:adenylate kinase
MILLAGVAGSGKSTQGKMLADEKGYAWLSTGEILRVLITGSRRQEMLKGKLLTDQEVINVVDKVLELIDPNDEFVLDGFPRTPKQLDWLLQEAKKGRFSRILVFHLTVSEKIVQQRLLQRGRLDDNEGAIAKRFEEYRSLTLPIIERLSQAGAQVIEIDAANDPSLIHAQIMKHVNGSE